MAADSRQTFRNRKGMARIGSDNASKLFQINSRVGVAISGLAFLPEDGVLKNVGKFIDEFKNEIEVEKLEVKEVADKLHYLFGKKYDYEKQLKFLPDKIKEDLENQGFELLEMETKDYAVHFSFKDKSGQTRRGITGIDKINLLVAGYNKKGGHEVYICYVPGDIQKKRDSQQKGPEYGAAWIGQIDVVSRIVLGFDSRVFNLKFINETAGTLGSEEVAKQLRGMEYVIQWGTMTLQDAIDFCTLMIQTTSAIQRFSDGVQSDPGDTPGVGGPVDVAVITPNEGFKWISIKKLTTDGGEQ